MAEDSGQEKTHQPSAEKLRKAADEGRYAYSKELVTAVAFLGILLGFYSWRHSLWSQLQLCLRDFLAFSRHDSVDVDTIGSVFGIAIQYMVELGGPVILLSAVLSVLANVLQTGFHVSSKKSMLDFNRINPTQGWQKLFSIPKVVEGIKSLAKAGLFAWVGFATLKGEMDTLLLLGSMPIEAGMATIGSVAAKIALRAGLLLAIFAIADFAYEKWQHRKNLMMTHQEMREESKDSEGDPNIRRRQRALQSEMSRNRMISAVPKADVVITNPTHYAVAIKYDPQAGAAPRLLAKGQLLVAQRIKDEAKKHGVPVVEDKFVARTIYKNVKVGQEIPYNLYRAVAEILAYVYKIKGKTPRRAQPRPRALPAHPRKRLPSRPAPRR